MLAITQGRPAGGAGLFELPLGGHVGAEAPAIRRPVAQNRASCVPPIVESISFTWVSSVWITFDWSTRCFIKS